MRRGTRMKKRRAPTGVKRLTMSVLFWLKNNLATWSKRGNVLKEIIQYLSSSWPMINCHLDSGHE